MDNFFGEIISLIAPTLRLATPLIFAALGGIISERAGVVNIGLEGMMTIGAFFAVWGTAVTGSPWIGIVFAMVSAGLLALLHAYMSISLKIDQVISGTAINILAASLASFLIHILFNTGGQTDTVRSLPYPGAAMGNVPLIGGILSGLNWFVIGAIVLVFVSSFVMFKTPYGMRMRAVGEHPKAADTLGINVYKTRYACVILSGVLAGIGGATLSISSSGIFRDGMVAGKGFIALAAVIFGNWKPKGALYACLLFGFAEALQIKAQGFAIQLPTEFYSMLPYILTMLALAGFVGKTVPPAASGQPYEKGQR